VSRWHPGDREAGPANGPTELRRGMRVEEIAVSPSILARRQAAAHARSRRLLVTDTAIALAVVLVALIAGAGVGMLGVIAVLALAGFGAAMAVGWLRRRRTGASRHLLVWPRHRR
jgi:hypothetical protein